MSIFDEEQQLERIDTTVKWVQYFNLLVQIAGIDDRPKNIIYDNYKI